MMAWYWHRTLVNSHEFGKFDLSRLIQTDLLYVGPGHGLWVHLGVGMSVPVWFYIKIFTVSPCFSYIHINFTQFHTSENFY